jgi:hypothetical protein
VNRKAKSNIQFTAYLLLMQQGYKKTKVRKIEIVPRKFYAEAYRDTSNPQGVVRLYRVTRAPSNPPAGDFCYQSVRIKNPEELSKVRPTIDLLSGLLGWEKLPPMLEALEKQIVNEQPIDPEIRKIVEQHPRAALNFLKVFDEVIPENIEIEDFDLISDYMKVALQSLLGKQVIMVNLLTDIINKLGQETEPEGIQKLLRLMENHTLPEITTVAGIITTRLQKLRLFETSIQNENAYEIKGPNSIHKQIAQSMWILNDSYWLLQENEALTSFLKKEYPERKGSKNQKKRPDFICVTDAHTLIIVEIKRPSHDMERSDINQIEDYLVTVEEQRPEFKTVKGYLIGKSMDPHLQGVLKKVSGLEFKPYTKVVDDCKQRYQQYIKAMEATSRTNS